MVALADPRWLAWLDLTGRNPYFFASFPMAAGPIILPSGEPKTRAASMLLATVYEVLKPSRCAPVQK